jgi:regulatory protein
MHSNHLHTAVRLLHRREQSCAELRKKLLQKGANLEVIEVVIARCQAQGWQSDARFVSMWLRHGYQKGQGLNKLRYELQSQHQIASRLIEETLIELDLDWFALAETVLAKKLNGTQAQDLKQQMKAYQFMVRRGFDAEAIQYAIQALKAT